MAENKNFRRMGGNQALNAQFYLNPWIDLPESVLFRMPELRDWNSSQKKQWEDLQDKFNQLARLLQNQDSA